MSLSLAGLGNKLRALRHVLETIETALLTFSVLCFWIVGDYWSRYEAITSDLIVVLALAGALALATVFVGRKAALAWPWRFYLGAILGALVIYFTHSLPRWFLLAPGAYLLLLVLRGAKQPPPNKESPQ